MDASRRSFLALRPSRARRPQRPPWARAETAFTSACTRCGDCLAACPEGILVAGAGGYPVVDFSLGGCTFCGDCARACAPAALDRHAATPWGLRARVADACLARQGVLCRSCGDACAAGALRFPPRLGAAALPLLAAEACTGCGACVPVCPAGAVSLAEPEPELTP